MDDPASGRMRRAGRKGWAMTLRFACRSAIGLGIVSALTMAVAVLALTDIYHGEADVTAEWQAVRVAFIVSAAFHVVSVGAALKGLRSES